MAARGCTRSLLVLKPCRFIFDEAGMVGCTCSNVKESSALDRKCVMQQKSPPIPDDTTEFLHRRADTKHNVTCEDGLE